MTDKQLLRVATQFRKGMLGNRSSEYMCAMVSWPLAALLGAQGVKCRTVEGDLGECNHVWIELADGRVLDPTANLIIWSALPMALSVHGTSNRSRSRVSEPCKVHA